MQLSRIQEHDRNHYCNVNWSKEKAQKQHWLALLESCIEKTYAKKLRDCISWSKGLRNQNKTSERSRSLFVEYINDEVSSNPKLQNNGTIQNQWFSREGTGETGTFEIKCINIGCRDSKSVLEKDNTFGLYKPEGEYWYHGTTLESAESIRKEGIKLEEGRDAQDFSHSSGFYLNPEFVAAENWAKYRFGTTASAVLIYQFSLDSFEGLNLHRNHEKWKKTVEYYRNRCPCSMRNAMRKELRKVDYIIGPMSAGGKRERSKIYVPRIKDGTSQLCIRSDNMTIKVTLALRGIVYFNG